MTITSLENGQVSRSAWSIASQTAGSKCDPYSAYPIRPTPAMTRNVDRETIWSIYGSLPDPQRDQAGPGAVSFQMLGYHSTYRLRNLGVVIHSWQILESFIEIPQIGIHRVFNPSQRASIDRQMAFLGCLHTSSFAWLSNQIKSHLVSSHVISYHLSISSVCFPNILGSLGPNFPHSLGV